MGLTEAEWGGGGSLGGSRASWHASSLWEEENSRQMAAMGTDNANAPHATGLTSGNVRVIASLSGACDHSSKNHLSRVPPLETRPTRLQTARPPVVRGGERLEAHLPCPPTQNRQPSLCCVPSVLAPQQPGTPGCSRTGAVHRLFPRDPGGTCVRHAHGISILAFSPVPREEGDIEVLMTTFGP